MATASLAAPLPFDWIVAVVGGNAISFAEVSERARLLAAFEAVDYVVLFDEDTPAKLVKAIRPDVLVKGEDYQGKEVVGREHAGKVVLSPLVKGISTSDIIRRIRNHGP